MPLKVMHYEYKVTAPYLIFFKASFTCKHQATKCIVKRNKFNNIKSTHLKVRDSSPISSKIIT